MEKFIGGMNFFPKKKRVVPLKYPNSTSSECTYHALNFASHWLQDQGGRLWTGPCVLSISRPVGLG